MLVAPALIDRLMTIHWAGVTGKEIEFSVADPGCLSRIPDPDFYPSRIPDLGYQISDPGSRISDTGSRIPDPGSRIPDPKTATKERGEKKIFLITFYVATNFTKLKIILVLKC
jgi:hypothetical protein